MNIKTKYLFLTTLLSSLLAFTNNGMASNPGEGPQITMSSISVCRTYPIEEFRLAEKRFLDRTNAITDFEAANIFDRLKDCSSLFEFYKDHCYYYLVHMHLEQRSFLMADEDAAAILYRLNDCDNLHPIKKDQCAWKLANMRYSYRANNITDTEAGDLFVRAYTSPHLATLCQDPAQFQYPIAFKLAEMRTANRAFVFTLEQAAQTYFALRDSQYMSMSDKILGCYRLALMRVYHQTDIISDDQAARALKDLRNDARLSILERNHAELKLAEMQAVNRTQVISAEEAAVINSRAKATEKLMIQR
jgi:hypothetical protein